MVVPSNKTLVLGVPSIGGDMVPFCLNLTLTNNLTVATLGDSLSTEAANAPAVVAYGRPSIYDLITVGSPFGANGMQFKVNSSVMPDAGLRYEWLNNSVIPEIFWLPRVEWQFFFGRWATTGMYSNYFFLSPPANVSLYMRWNGTYMTMDPFDGTDAFMDSASWRPISDAFCGYLSNGVALQWKADPSKYMIVQLVNKSIYSPVTTYVNVTRLVNSTTYVNVSSNISTNLTSANRSNVSSNASNASNKSNSTNKSNSSVNQSGNASTVSPATASTTYVLTAVTTWTNVTTLTAVTTYEVTSWSAAFQAILGSPAIGGDLTPFCFDALLTDFVNIASIDNFTAALNATHAVVAFGRPSLADLVLVSKTNISNVPAGVEFRVPYTTDDGLRFYWAYHNYTGIVRPMKFDLPQEEWQWFLGQYSSTGMYSNYINIATPLKPYLYMRYDSVTAQIWLSPNDGTTSFMDESSWRPIADPLCGYLSGGLALQWKADPRQFLFYNQSSDSITIWSPTVTSPTVTDDIRPYCFNATLTSKQPIATITNFTQAFSIAPAVILAGRPSMTDLLTLSNYTAGVLLIVSPTLLRSNLSSWVYTLSSVLTNVTVNQLTNMTVNGTNVTLNVTVNDTQVVYVNQSSLLYNPVYYQNTALRYMWLTRTVVIDTIGLPFVEWLWQVGQFDDDDKHEYIYLASGAVVPLSYLRWDASSQLMVADENDGTMDWRQSASWKPINDPLCGFKSGGLALQWLDRKSVV